MALPFGFGEPEKQYWQTRFDAGIQGSASYLVLIRGMFRGSHWREYLIRHASENGYRLAHSEHHGTNPGVYLLHFIRRTPDSATAPLQFPARTADSVP